MTYNDTRAALEAAIRADLNRLPTTRGILTDWLVIAAQESIAADGTTDSGITILTPRDSYPLYRAMGLLDTATITYSQIIASRSSGNE